MIAPQPFYQDRGTPIAVRLVADALLSLGAQVDVLTYPEGEDLVVEGLTILRIRSILPIHHVPIGFSWKKVALDIALSNHLRKLLREVRYDAIHAVEEATLPAILWRGKIPLLY
ncbi:MAG: glycosyltransferase, partial [Gemmatimonadetes bacterium]|nr:glycosyltransferase [Gemmatimonadota bacterium]